MEEEKKFFEEIKQLMNEYVEYDNTEILENWEEEKAILQSEIEEKNKQFEEIKESRKKAVEDLRVTDNIQKSLRKDSHAYKGSKQDFHDARQKSIVKNRKYREVEQELKQAKEELSKREGSVNELIKTRTEQGKEKKEEIYNKTKEFISANTEKMQQEIIAKREKLKEVAKNRKKATKEKDEAVKVVEELKVRTGETSHAYKGSKKDLEEAMQKVWKHNREYKIAKEELKQAEGKLAEFEGKYSGIDFESDGGIQSLMDITGWEKELTLEETLQKASKDLSVEEVQVMMSAIYSLRGTNMADKMKAINKGASYDEIGLDEEAIEVMKKAIGNMTSSQLENIIRQMQTLGEKSIFEEWASLSNNVYEYKVNMEKETGKIEDVFAKIENGFEDIVKENSYYQESKRNTISNLIELDKEEYKKQIAYLSSKTIMDLYKMLYGKEYDNALNNKDTKTVQKIEQMMEELKARKEELEKKEGIHKLTEDEVEVVRDSEEAVESTKQGGQTIIDVEGIIVGNNPEPKEANPSTKDVTKSEPKEANPSTKDATKSEPKEANPSAKDVTKSEPKTANPSTKDATKSEPKTANPSAKDVTKSEPKVANSTTKASTKRVSMPIRKIEIDANKRKVIVHFTRQGDWPKEYPIKKLLSHKSTIIYENKNDMPKDIDKNFKRKLNPLWLGPLQECNDKEVYDMVKAYINNLDENNEKMQLPVIEYHLKKSRLSPKNYHKVLKYARNEEELDNVDVDRNKTLGEKVKDFFHRNMVVRAIGDGAKITGRTISKTSKKAVKNVKNHAITLHENFQGTKVAKQMNRASTFIKETRVGKQISKVSNNFVKGLKQGVPTQEEQAIRAGERKRSKMDHSLDNIVSTKDFQL